MRYGGRSSVRQAPWIVVLSKWGVAAQKNVGGVDAEKILATGVQQAQESFDEGKKGGFQNNVDHIDPRDKNVAGRADTA